MHIIHNSNKTDIPIYIQYSTANQPLTDDGVYSSHSRPWCSADAVGWPSYGSSWVSPNRGECATLPKSNCAGLKPIVEWGVFLWATWNFANFSFTGFELWHMEPNACLKVCTALSARQFANAIEPDERLELLRNKFCTVVTNDLFRNSESGE